MGGLVKLIFGGGDSGKEYDKALAEQEHRKKLAEEEARQKELNRARQTALAQAEEEKRKKAFLAQSSNLTDDQKLGKKTTLG